MDNSFSEFCLSFVEIYERFGVSVYDDPRRRLVQNERECIYIMDMPQSHDLKSTSRLLTREIDTVHCPFDAEIVSQINSDSNQPRGYFSLVPIFPNTFTV